MKQEQYRIPRASSPEEVGVSSKMTEAFIKEVEESGLELHSLMVLRHGKVAAEWYNAPYGSDTPNAMYSVSKSFTSAAIGFAVHEGILSLDDKVVDFFPEYPPRRPHPNFDLMTIRTLITMTSGKQTNILNDRTKMDWVESFINSPWAFTPGEKFLYVNENIFMLCACLCKRTGISVTEFLTPRLFEPLGIEVPFWETNNAGVEAGGWGLYIKTEDLAKYMLCLQNGGEYMGRQVLPKEWVEQATSNQLNCQQPGHDKDGTHGYGFCFWMNDTEPASYRADGMFSQFGINFPSLDASVITTAAVANEPELREHIWNYFPAAFLDEEAKKEPVVIKNGVLESFEPSKRSPREAEIANRTIHFRKKLILNIAGYPASVLPLSVTFMLSAKTGNIDNVSFAFGDKECTFNWSEGRESNTVLCGMDGRYRYDTMRLAGMNFKVCCHAKWSDDDTLEVHIRPIETIAKRKLRFSFGKTNNKVLMQMYSTPTMDQMLKFFQSMLPELIPSKWLSDIAVCAAKHVPGEWVRWLLEPNHHGKFVD